jgi:hypothetical protein
MCRGCCVAVLRCGLNGRKRGVDSGDGGDAEAGVAGTQFSVTEAREIEG